MAGAGYKLFNTGDVLTAAQVNTYLQEQAVMRFANATARTTALSGVLAEGMMSYLDDTNSVEVYNGSSWVSVGNTGDITGVTAGTGLSGGGTSGDVTVSLSTPVSATNGGTAQTTYTTGDLLYASATNTLAKRAIGSTNQVLTVSGGVPTWAAAPSPTAQGVSVYNNVGQSCTSGVYTTLTFNSEYVDTDAFHSTSSNTSRLTVPAGLGGKYIVVGKFYFNPGVNGSPTQKFTVNGNDSRRITVYIQASDTGALLNVATLNLNAGDYVEALFYHASGASKDVTTDQYGEFSMYRIGA